MNLTIFDDVPDNFIDLDDTSENINKINVIKQAEPILTKPILTKPILRRYPLVNQIKKPSISYDDLLNNMGLYVDNGLLQTNINQNSLSIKGKGTQVKMECSKVKGCMQNVPSQSTIPQNSYIYNKYFKEHLKPVAPIVPKTPEEYKQLIVQNLIEKRMQQLRVGQIKSTKLIMPTNNIHISPIQINRVANVNRFFRYPSLNNVSNNPNLIYSMKR